MLKQIYFISFILILPFLAQAQKDVDPYQKKYEWRIRQEVLYGTYIPKDVNDALIRLNRLTDEESKAKFKNLSETEAVNKLYFSFGRWISYNWGFHDGSRLSVNLRSMGIFSPEDMTRFMMVLFHRSLNKKPLDIKELLKQIHQKNEIKKEERMNKGTIIHEESRKREKPAEGNN